MKLSQEIANSLNPLSTFRLEKLKNVDLTGISQDSRKVSEGNIFVCIAGERVDGHDFIPKACNQGASLIVCEKELDDVDCPYIVVKDTKLAMAQLSAELFNHPSKEIDLIGITGTNGKTTVTHLVETIFEKTGQECALIGTLGNRFSSTDEYVETAHTTPQAPELQESFRSIADKNISKVVLEVSSHSLDQHRVAASEFTGAVFTNLTQDHLDYHITMDKYFEAKTKLLSLLKKHSDKNKYAVINVDDKYFKKLPNFLPQNVEGLKVLTYGVDNKADITAKNLVFSEDGTEFACETPYGNIEKVKLQLSGLFNVYNVLAAIGVGLAEGIELKTCIEAVESVQRIPGRFEVISRKPLVIVDYAHTPNGLENVLDAARALVPQDGELICVFGCGGDRDVTKRPQMGGIAENISDKVYITSDNPRTEDPQQIITDILTGIKELNSKKIFVEPDRAIAIEQAILGAKSSDVIVLAGKGHEDYQIVGDEKLHFDDKEEAQKALCKIS